VAAQSSLIAEVENAIASGSSEKRVESLRRVTDLFLVNTNQYSESQVDVFGDVMSRLVSRIETKAKAELANRLAPVKNAPVAVVRSLARDESINVAGPVLQHSTRLSDDDLLACAGNSGQDRLLAISKRVSISEAVGDALVSRGGRDVVQSVAENAGARFSNTGYAKLVERAVEDEVLALCVGMRKDMPKQHLRSLVLQVSEAVSKKLTAENPAAAAEVQAVMQQLTGGASGQPKKAAHGYQYAQQLFNSIKAGGGALEPVVQQFARAGRFEETVVALSNVCHMPIAAIEHIMTEKQIDNQLVLILARFAGFSWPTANAILQLRWRDGGLSHEMIGRAHVDFEELKATTAQRIIRFYQIRHGAAEPQTPPA
jgi:uncharacterized protein (DUF2336 family)